MSSGTRPWSLHVRPWSLPLQPWSLLHWPQLLSQFPVSHLSLWPFLLSESLLSPRPDITSCMFPLRLAREQARVRELQSGNQQLEEQRVELVERLQAMLQAHWEEATRLLSTTTLPPHPPVGRLGSV